MRYLVTCLLLFIGVALGGARLSHAQTGLAPLTFASVVAEKSSDTTATITWRLNRAPTAAENARLIVKNSAGVQQGRTETIGTKDRGTVSVRGKLGEKFKLEVQDANFVAIDPTSDVTVTEPKAGSSSSSSGDAFKFQDTLFGDNVTAPQYVRSLYIWSVGIAILGATAMIVYAGYKYTASRGNPSEINNAKEIIISSLVGLALLLLSFTILRFLGINVKNATEESVRSSTTK